MKTRFFVALLLAAMPLTAQPVRRHAVVHQPVVPAAGHVFLVLLENTDESVAENEPYFHTLAAAGALLENYHGVAHPSQPNYIALAAGSAWGIRDDTPVTIDVPHLGDLIESRGRSWKVYAEDYPGSCYLGATFGTVAGGQYVRRHVPFLDFADVQRDPARCSAHIVDAAQLDADVASGSLPDFSLYVPNDQHNGHDSDPATADTWLQSRFAPLLANPLFARELLFIVTFDESGSATDSKISAVLLGDTIRPGSESFDWYDHYSLLRTIEDALGLGSLGQQDATAPLIIGIWR